MKTLLLRLLKLLIALILLISCKVDSLTFNEPQPSSEKELESFPLEFQGKWKMKGERNLYWISKGKVFQLETISTAFPISDIRKEGYLLKGDSLFQLEEPIFDSLNPVLGRLIGLEGDTLLTEREDGKRMFVMDERVDDLFFLTHDSSSIHLKNDSLFLNSWKWEIFFQQYKNVLIREKKGYIFINIPKERTRWTVWFLKKNGPDELMFATTYNQVETGRRYFEVREISQLKEDGDTIVEHFAAPRPAQLLRFLKDDSLKWIPFQRAE